MATYSRLTAAHSVAGLEVFNSARLAEQGPSQARRCRTASDIVWRFGTFFWRVATFKSSVGDLVQQDIFFASRAPYAILRNTPTFSRKGSSVGLKSDPA